MKLTSATETRSAPALIIGAALAYVVASVVRTIVVPDSVTETYIGRSLDVSLLYAITLLPGIIVGYYYGRRVLEFGFLAGALGEILRHGVQLVVAVSSAPEAVPVEVPWLSTMLGGVIGALPSGVLGAAGGAVGYIFRARVMGRLAKGANT